MEELYLRRSVRAYLDKPVEREKLIDVIKAGTCAPSAMNNNERQFTAIVNKDVKAQLCKAVWDTLDKSFRDRILGRTGGAPSFFYDAPVLIIVSTAPNSHCPAADCAVALENMFLKATELGLATCWINQLVSTCDSPAIREVLGKAGVPASHKVYGACALGYSDTPSKKITEKENKIVICD